MFPICQHPKCRNRVKSGCHHIFGKKAHPATRWHLGNGIGLCWGHHRWWAHDQPERFRDFVVEWMGEDTFQRLKQAAYRTEPYNVPDLEEAVNILADIIKQIGRRRIKHDEDLCVIVGDHWSPIARRILGMEDLSKENSKQHHQTEDV